jgi:uncharacterized membrane protein YuzA (DUF378 family)
LVIVPAQQPHKCSIKYILIIFTLFSFNQNLLSTVEIKVFVIYRLLVGTLIINGRYIMTKYLQTICLSLAIIGGINWFSIGLFDLNIVNYIFGSLSFIEKSIYILVGIASIYSISIFGMICRQLCK